jgi:hypothetical protein
MVLLFFRTMSLPSTEKTDAEEKQAHLLYKFAVLAQ